MLGTGGWRLGCLQQVARLRSLRWEAWDTQALCNRVRPRVQLQLATQAGHSASGKGNQGARLDMINMVVIGFGFNFCGLYIGDLIALH